MSLKAQQYYAIKYLGVQDDYMGFSVGIDNENSLYEYWISLNDDILTNGYVWTYHTNPNRTDAEFTEEHQIMFDDVTTHLKYIIKNLDYTNGQVIKRNV